VNNPEVQTSGRSSKFKLLKLLLTLVGSYQYTDAGEKTEWTLIGAAFGMNSWKCTIQINMW